MNTNDMISGRYRVLSLLGQGGMGAVYRVADTQDGDRPMALKLIQVQGTITPELRLRFKEEFRAMVKLKHPNTIEVYDYNQLDAQTQYLTMEIVPGAELTDLIRGQRLSLDDTYSYLIQLLQALGFIHSRLYVHRDIKAENIRVKEDGTLKLMDFGLMDQLGNPSNGKITGTPGYLPPEVAKGGVINASSDLYSVGCLAYEMLTGSLPFTGNVLDVIRAHIDRQPEPLAQHRPDLPPSMVAIVEKLLTKDQKLRYQEASEVIADLADVAGLSLAKDNLEQKKSYLTSSVLVGRDKELAQLMDALKDVGEGRGRSVFVGAPAGVGKSRLVHELILQAKLNDWVILHGQCLESGMAPYEPLALALKPLVSLSTPEERAAHGPALARAVPEFQAHGVQPLAALEGSKEKDRFHEALVAWVQSVSARTPLVLFFDDLHWTDAQSLEAFNTVIRAIGKYPVMALGTFRNDEVVPSSPVWYTIEEGLTAYLKLTNFNLPQVMLLIQAMLRDVNIGKKTTEFLYNATSGNAFFITEILRYLIEEGLLVKRDDGWHFPDDVDGLEIPNSVEATVVRRLAQLSPEGRNLACVAAVLGRYQDRDMLITVSKLSEDAFFARVDELIERQFLIKDEDRFTFPHDRVREALYDTMETAQRAAIHQACGESLEKLHAANREAMVNELAYHFGNGTDMQKAYRYLRQAGDMAKAAGIGMVTMENWDKAERILDTLDLPNKEEEQVDLWFEMGSFGFELLPSVASRVLEKLVAVLEAQGNVDGVCNVLKGAVSVVKKLPPAARDTIIGQLTKPVPYKHKVRTGLAKLVPPPPPAWVPRVIESRAFLGTSYGFSGQPNKGFESINRALALLPFTDTPLEGALLVSSCVCLCPAGRFDEMIAAATKAGDTLGNKGDLMGLKVALAARVGYADHMIANAFQGIRPSQEHEDFGLWAAEAVDAPYLFNIIWSRRAIYHAWTGRHEASAEIVERMTQHCRKVGAPLHQAALYVKPYLLWQRGEFEEAKALIFQALRYPHIDNDDFHKQLIYILKGQVHLALGELAEAETDLVAAYKRGQWGGMGLVSLLSQLWLGHLAVAKGDRADARQKFEAARNLAVDKATRNPLHQALAERALGELDLAEGQPAAARARFEAAMAIVSTPDQDNVIEQAHLRRLLGDVALAEGAEDQARALYVQAGEAYHGLKNRHFLREISRKLEGLRRVDAPEVAMFAVVEEQKETMVSVLASKWKEHFVRLSTINNEDQFVQTLLEALRDALGAEEVSLYTAIPSTRFGGARTAAGPAGELKVNQALVSQVLTDKAGLVTLDIPDEMALGAGSNIELEIPSVVAAPVLKDGRAVGAFYAVKRDISSPFEDEALEVLTAFCAMVADGFGDRLGNATVLSKTVNTSQYAADLRASLHSASMAGKSQMDVLGDLVGSFAKLLKLDEAAIVSGDGDVVTCFPATTTSVVNVELVGRVAASRAAETTVELPDFENGGSLVGVEVTSVLATPILQGEGVSGVLYCVRKDAENPFSDEDQAAATECGKVFGDALHALVAGA